MVFNEGRLGCQMEDGVIIDLNLAYTSLLHQRGVSRPYSHANAELPSDLQAFIEEDSKALKAAEISGSPRREGLPLGAER